jgi:Holliday junction resolvase RusA-like endonuclease
VSATANTSSTAASVARGAGRAPSAAGGARDVPPVSLTMPMPPSVNGAFRNVRGKGRVLTAAAAAWKDEALWRIRIQHPRTIAGPVVIVLGFERGAHLDRADVDNRCKLAIDVLVSAGVIHDDRAVVGFAAAWMPPINGLAHVLVVPAQRMTLSFHPSTDGAAGGWIVEAPQLHMEDDDGDQPRVA